MSDLKTLEKRIEKLEEKAKPKIIATLADFVIWRADPNRDPDVELSPQMQELFGKSTRRRSTK